jgi:tRNA modification GTPase
MMSDDTIYALSSGAPPAGIAVVRISGSRAGAMLDRLTGGRRPAPRQAVLRALRDPADGGLLDQALILWFPGPATATGEDLAELHLHGGRAVVAAILACLGREPALRAATAGEFTRRAFYNGRIDLIETEALGDLLAAETEAQRRNAIRLADGALSRAVEAWQMQLLSLSARIEAALDFADEEDVAPPDITVDLARLAGEIERWRGRPAVERLRDGVRVVLAGPPNAGKSTLLNALVGREAAIVTPIAGTTRDLVEVPVAIGGVAFMLTDTAGLRDDTTDLVEAIGVERAQRAAETADILLWLGDPGEAPDRSRIVVGAKADQRRLDPASYDVVLSATTGAGMNHLIAMLIERARRLLPVEGEVALNARQRLAIDGVAAGLGEAIAGDDLILVAESLRAARHAIDGLTGRAGTEELFDSLFGAFCIGK